MQWYFVQLRQDEALRLNGHMRARSAEDAIKAVLGRDRRWPIENTKRHGAQAVDPKNPDNWCRASEVSGPAWPITPEERRNGKRRAPRRKATAKTPAGRKTKATPAASPTRKRSKAAVKSR